MVNSTTISELDLEPSFSWVAELDEEKLKDDAYCFDLFKSAFTMRSKKLTEALIAKGANVNAKGKRGWTPLHCAVSIFCSCGDEQRSSDCVDNPPLSKDIVSLLIEKGADINAKSNDLSTPLHLAVRENNPDIVRLLINNGAEVDLRGNGDMTPLYCAIKHDNDKDIIKLLIDKGADVNVKTFNGYTPLHLAVEKENIDVAKLLIGRGVNVNVENNSKNTPLHLAVERNNTNIVKLLINNCAEVDHKGDRGKGLLFYATLYHGSNKDIIELLIDNGADVNVKFFNDYTPLQLTISGDSMGDSIDSVKLLISKGADVNAKDKNGHTALYVATHKNKVNIAKLLISNGADVNAKDNSGNTLLQVAKGNEEMTTLLENAALKQVGSSTTEQVPTIESFLEAVTSFNRSNGIIDTRNSEIPNTTPMMLSHLRHNLGNIINSTPLLLGSDAENGTFNNASNLSSINGNALLMFIGYVCAYAYRKMFSPSTIVDTLSLGQISKLQK